MAIPLRTDFDAITVRAAARRSKDGAQARRLLALAAIYEGAIRTEAARIGGVTLQIVRDWVMKFNAAGPDGLIDRKAPGRRSLLNAAHRAALVEAIERGPIPAAHGVVRWRIIDLAQMLRDDFALSVSKPTLSRELRALGYRKLSARPRHHAQDPDAIEAFKGGLCRRAGQGHSVPPARHTDRGLVSGRSPDRAKNKITRRWAKRGTRPSAPHDQRTKSAYIFGAICPQEGKAAGLVLPFCNTDTMNLHLAEISRTVAPGAHAVLLMDQAGWHLTPKLELPTKISIVAIPSKSRELNPQENVWQFMRDNWLSNRVFSSYDEIVDHCCDAWHKLVEQPWRIMSISLRDWAHGF